MAMTVFVENRAFTSCLIWVALLGQLSCQSTLSSTPQKSLSEPLKFRVEAAPEWTDLFYRKSGWFGADGVFSIPLDGIDTYAEGKEVLLIFSDTYVGDVVDNKPAPGDTMVNNSVAIFNSSEVTPENIRFFINHDDDGRPVSFFEPKERSSNGQYFWLGDGFVNKELDDRLYLFAYHIEKTGPDVFDFKEVDVSLLSLPGGSRPPFRGYRQISTPLHISIPELGEGSLGAGILVNTRWAQVPHPDGFVYVYGCIGADKNLVAARVKPVNFENFDQWQYWNGIEWSKEIDDLEAITKSVSNELSVTPLDDGRFLLVFQVLGISDKVGIMIGASPVGPFSEIQEIYRTPEIDDDLLPYNAKAHPALSKPGELLISYNTITFDFWNDIKDDAHIYRPRFIRMIFE
jgi:hypothetical protein